jgi:hypothetical protein
VIGPCTAECCSYFEMRAEMCEARMSPLLRSLLSSLRDGSWPVRDRGTGGPPALLRSSINAHSRPVSDIRQRQLSGAEKSPPRMSTRPPALSAN